MVPAWYVLPLMLYSKVAPVGALIVMVPVGTGHVGCCVTLAVGAAGLADIGFIVIAVAVLMQPVAISLTVMVLELLGANPAKTALN